MGPREAPPAAPVDQGQQQVTHTEPGSPSLQGEENLVNLSWSHLPGSLGKNGRHYLPISPCPWNQHLLQGLLGMYHHPHFTGEESDTWVVK